MSKKKDDDQKQDKWQEFSERTSDESLEDEQVSDENVERIDLPSHEALEKELNAAEMKLAEYKDAAIRAKAEADNVRRRAERDVQNAHKYGAEKLLTDLLPIVDSLVRGLEGLSSEDATVTSIREGMELTLSMLEKTLEKHGVEVLSPEKGVAFDPASHEAMSMQPAPDAESNTILQVLQKGYVLNGRVIRAAMVIVAS